ncbi:MAG: hypothetical protein RLY23_487 [Actinomycetota bacterium]
MDLAAHFRIIARAWKQILIAGVLVAVAMFFWSNRAERVYEATALLAVTPSDTGLGINADQATFLAKSYALYAETPRVTAEAAKSSGLDITANDAASLISASAVGDLGFLEVYAAGPSVSDAEKLASAATVALIDAVRAQQTASLAQDIAPIQAQRVILQKQLSDLPAFDPQAASIQANIDALNQVEAERRAQPANRVNVAASAHAPSTPISPHPTRSAVVAFLLTCILVGELIVASRAIGDRIGRTGDDDADVARITGLPVLGRIPKGEGFETVEAFRVLRTNLMVLEAAGRPRTVAVVSNTQDAGKSFISINLAQSASALDDKVVLIDADLRRPTIHERLSVPRTPGLTSVLLGSDLSEALRKVAESPFLRVLSSGPPVEDPSAILGARAFRVVLDTLRAVRLVVVDTPPSGLFSDALAVASQCDATIFVLDLKNSKQQQVRQALEELQRAGANVVGVVVNRTEVVNRSAYYEA